MDNNKMLAAYKLLLSFLFIKTCNRAQWTRDFRGERTSASSGGQHTAGEGAGHRRLPGLLSLYTLRH